MREARTMGGTRACAVAIAAALAAMAAPEGARADEDAYRKLTTLESRLELGVLYNSRNDFKFGDFTGLDNKGFEWIGESDIRLRSAYDADLPYYFRLRGLNLGLESRYLEAVAEMPGLVGFEFWWDEIPKFQSDTAKTPYRNLDSTILTLPPGWIPGNNPAPTQMPLLEASLQRFDVKHERRALGGSGSLVLPWNLEFDASYERETKRGNKITAGLIGQNGGNPYAVLIPEEIDYTFHNIESNLRYAGDGFQAQLQYFGSGFENDHDQTRWQNPYLADADFDPAAEYPAFGRKGQAPDNWFHQGVFSAGVDLPVNSRLMMNTAFGWGRQDESFLPYTLNPGFDTPIDVALPRDSLNGKVRTGMASLRFVSRPLPKLDLAFGYRWNERDNDTPVDVYQRVLNDAGDATDPDQDFENAHINRPYGHDKHKVDVDVSYRLPLRSKVTLSYDFEQIRRHLEEVDQSDEHGFGVKLITRPFNRVSIGIRAQRSYRDEDHYDCVEPLVQTEPPSLLGDPGCEFGQDFENHPDLRKYNQTDRRRWDTHLWANIAPLDDVNLGFKVRYVDDDYFNSELGLVDQRYFSTGMDASWTPTDRLLFHLFYDYEERRSKQDSLSWSPFSSPTNLSNGWSTRDTDRFHTTGLGFEFTVIPERVTLGAEYLFARSREILDTRVNTFREDRPFPDATTELHDVSLRSELHLTENFSLRVGYLYERFKSRDWQIDEVCPACLAADGDEAAVLALGEESPDYSAHVGTVSLIFRFR